MNRAIRSVGIAACMNDGGTGQVFAMARWLKATVGAVPSHSLSFPSSAIINGTISVVLALMLLLGGFVNRCVNEFRRQPPRNDPWS